MKDVSIIQESHAKVTKNEAHKQKENRIDYTFLTMNFIFILGFIFFPFPFLPLFIIYSMGLLFYIIFNKEDVGELLYKQKGFNGFITMFLIFFLGLIPSYLLFWLFIIFMIILGLGTHSIDLGDYDYIFWEFSFIFLLFLLFLGLSTSGGKSSDDDYSSPSALYYSNPFRWG